MHVLSSLNVESLIFRMVFAPNDPLLLCCEGNRLLVCNYLGGLSRRESLATDSIWLTDVSCHPFEDQVAFVGEFLDLRHDAPIEFWNFTNQDRWKKHVDLGERGQRVKYSSDGKWLIAVGNSEIYQVLSLPSGDVAHQFPGGEQNRAVDFHPDLKTVLSTRWSQGDTNIQFCELGPELLHRMPSEAETYLPWWDEWEAQFITIRADAISDAIFSPDGSYIAYAHSQVKIHNFPQKRLLRTFRGSAADIIKINSGSPPDPLGWSNPIFSKDSRLLYVGSPNGVIYCWNVQTGEITHWDVGHVGAIRSLALSPDGQYLASSGEDKTLKLARLTH